MAYLIRDLSSNIVIRTNDTSSNVIISTGNTNRVTISNTGAWTYQGGMSYNNATNALTATTFIGDLSGNATNIAGGAGGSIPYQSSANTTALLANGTAGQVLTSAGGTSAPTWTTISVPSPTLTQTEDFVYFPKLILDAPYPDLAGIIGTQIPLAVYNYNGATVQPYNGNYNANLNSGALQRLGCMLLYSGAPGYTQHTGINEYSFTQISKITWGFCCLGNNTPDGFHTLTSNVTYTFGLALSSDRASSLFADNTSNSIFWCWNGSTYSPPTTTQFRLVINNVDRYTLTTNTNMTGKWARAGFTITYVSGNTADVQGFFTDLSTGVTETTGTYTITGGVGFPNPITNPNACSVYQSIYADAGNPRWLLIDYCQVETPNLYQIGVGSTQITGR